MEKNIFLKLAEGIRDWLGGLGLSHTGVDVWMAVIGILFAIVFILLNALILVWAERRVGGLFQQRPGPNRNGPLGLFQTLFDVLKLLSKEDIIPKNADKGVFIAASIAIFVPAVLIYSVLTFDKGMNVADLNVGIFFAVSVASLTTLAFLMAGWSSNNKYSLLGGMRTVAQMISYEIALVFSLLGVVMITGSLRMSDIIEAQKNVWFIVPQFIAFIIYFVAGIAETNRGPFDLAEGEQELVAGALTEYSGMRWAMFFMAEYANLVAVSAIATTFFLGGYLPLFGLTFIPGWVWFLAKLYFMVFLFMWVRWTFPRIRIDHLMSFGWKFLIPVSLANVLITGIGIFIVQNVLPKLGW